MSYASKVVELNLGVLASPQQDVEQVVSCMFNGGWLLYGSYVLDQIRDGHTREQVLHLLFVRKEKDAVNPMAVPCPACGVMR